MFISGSISPFPKKSFCPDIFLPATLCQAEQRKLPG
jgi:hypothetical protein